MKKYLSIFVSSILAGFCITFGATVFLLCLNLGRNNGDFALLKVIGSFMFGIGLFTIIHFKFWLYTGKVGYVLDNKPKYLLDCLVCFLGNALGSIILASLIRVTNQGVALMSEATKIVEAKNDSSLYSIFIMSMMCGAMIYLAVEGHKQCPYTIGKVLFAFMPIALFILAGFEHVVANVTYYVYAGKFTLYNVLMFIIMFVGNGVGSIILDGSIKLVKYLNQNKENNSNIVQ